MTTLLYFEPKLKVFTEEENVNAFINALQYDSPVVLWGKSPPTSIEKAVEQFMKKMEDDQKIIEKWLAG